MALAEYLLQVPANRIGYTTMNLGQLKILQEVIAHFVHSSARCTHASSQTSHISSAIAESYSRSETHVRHVSMQVRQAHRPNNSWPTAQ